MPILHRIILHRIILPCLELKTYMDLGQIPDSKSYSFPTRF